MKNKLSWDMKDKKKFKKLEIEMNKEWCLSKLRWIRGIMRGLPHWLLVEHSHVVNLFLSVVILMVAAFLLIRVSFFAPKDMVVPKAEREELEVNLIDELEWWIEDIEAKKSRGLMIDEGKI